MTPVFSAAPTAALQSIVSHRELVWGLVKRDFLGRYRGSIVGVAWSLINPLLMLAIYSLVFSVAFKARWGASEGGKMEFALVLFSGMIVHSLYSECINRAPTLIVSQPNFVKKVVFPLDVLVWVVLCSAILQFLLNLAVLLVFCLIAGQPIHAGILLLPIILAPLLLFALGTMWLLASLGVYLRDLAQATSIVSAMLLFLSPVFYPADALPAEYRILLTINPITLPIEQMRNALLWEKPIDWMAWLLTCILGALVAHFGFWWFQRSRKGFADVL